MYQRDFDLSQMMARDLPGLIAKPETPEPAQRVVFVSTVGAMRDGHWPMPTDVPDDTTVEIVYTYPGDEAELRSHPWPALHDDHLDAMRDRWLYGHGLGEPIGLFNDRNPGDRVNVVRRYSNTFEQLAKALKDVKFESKSPVHDWSGQPIKPRKPRPIPTWKRPSKGRHSRPW